jgi:hypothetical protein
LLLRRRQLPVSPVVADSPYSHILLKNHIATVCDNSRRLPLPREAWCPVHEGISASRRDKCAGRKASARRAPLHEGHSRYLRARSVAACSIPPRLTAPQLNARNYPAGEAPDRGDIMSEYRATSSAFRSVIEPKGTQQWELTSFMPNCKRLIPFVQQRSIEIFVVGLARTTRQGVGRQRCSSRSASKRGVPCFLRYKGPARLIIGSSQSRRVTKPESASLPTRWLPGIIQSVLSGVLPSIVAGEMVEILPHHTCEPLPLSLVRAHGRRPASPPAACAPLPAMPPPRHRASL